MKICQKCGFKNEESTSDCVKCGEEIKESSEVDLTISFPQLIEEESRVKVEVLPGEAAVLVVTKGPVIGERFPVGLSEVTLGRDPGSDIFLDDITVSRRHAKITFKSPNYLLSDVGSLNGTYVNGKRISEAALNHRAEIQIGKFKLVFLLGETLK